MKRAGVGNEEPARKAQRESGRRWRTQGSDFRSARSTRAPYPPRTSAGPALDVIAVDRHHADLREMRVIAGTEAVGLDVDEGQGWRVHAAIEIESSMDVQRTGERTHRTPLYHRFPIEVTAGTAGCKELPYDPR